MLSEHTHPFLFRNHRNMRPQNTLSREAHALSEHIFSGHTQALKTHFLWTHSERTSSEHKHSQNPLLLDTHTLKIHFNRIYKLSEFFHWIRAPLAFVDYRFSFADLLKETSVFRFRLQQTNGSLPFPFSVCRKQKEVGIFCLFRFPFAEFRKLGDMKTWRHEDGDMKTWRHRHGDMETWRYEDMDMESSNGKRKNRQFSLTRLPFAHRANGSLSSVGLLVKTPTEVICLQTDKTD
jgi:hypothetical protein